MSSRGSSSPLRASSRRSRQMGLRSTTQRRPRLTHPSPLPTIICLRRCALKTEKTFRRFSWLVCDAQTAGSRNRDAHPVQTTSPLVSTRDCEHLAPEPQFSSSSGLEAYTKCLRSGSSPCLIHCPRKGDTNKVPSWGLTSTTSLTMRELLCGASFDVFLPKNILSVKRLHFKIPFT